MDLVPGEAGPGDGHGVSDAAVRHRASSWRCDRVWRLCAGDECGAGLVGRAGDAVACSRRLRSRWSRSRTTRASASPSVDAVEGVGEPAAFGGGPVAVLGDDFEQVPVVAGAGLLDLGGGVAVVVGGDVDVGDDAAAGGHRPSGRRVRGRGSRARQAGEPDRQGQGADEQGDGDRSGAGGGERRRRRGRRGGGGAARAGGVRRARWGRPRGGRRSRSRWWSCALRRPAAVRCGAGPSRARGGCAVRRCRRSRGRGGPGGGGRRRRWRGRSGRRRRPRRGGSRGRAARAAARGRGRSARPSARCPGAGPGSAAAAVAGGGAERRARRRAGRSG